MTEFAPLPEGKYGAILADPPWRFRNFSMKDVAEKGERWARRHGRPSYNCAETTDIAKLPVADLAAKDCVLFLWATYPKLPDALEVMSGWGFEYKSVALTWVKRNPGGLGWHFGLGFWTRGNPEILLLGTRGKPKRLDKSVPNLMISPRQEHSRKPDETYDRIERLVAGPYIELFSRSPRPGWGAWGDQCSHAGIDQTRGDAELAASRLQRAEKKRRDTPLSLEFGGKP